MVVALQNAYMATLFDKGDGLSKEVWVGQEWNPIYGQDAIEKWPKP
jgi:hypothetical protein